MTEISVFIAVTAGLLSFLSPCVLPIVPSYLSFVTGMTLEDLQESTDRRHVMVHSLLFVAGFSGVFIILGASASFLGVFFQAYEEWIARIGGVLIIGLGLHLMGVFRILPLLRERRVQMSDKPSGHLGTLAVGAAFGAGWTPCIGPVLGAILTLASTQETIWSGVGLLAAYSAGLAIPFLLAALALDRFLNTFKRMRRWIPVLEKASGALLVVLGLLLVTGSFTVLTGILARYTPEFLLERI
ncbi:cytochrome c biogenesis CcdA family protein [Gaopeijia maritima]|uniref:Cytochrome c biogenesis protein CcdA n=1 Tax=Gaopeijia maritima TaxID=3119007 RepID=A0ABU9E9I0_9BACT